MARINTNVGSMVAQSQLHRAQGSLNQALQRLSSGLRINRGADDPAGLIASESLRSEIQGVKTAVDNSQRASNIIATAEGALGEVSDLLVSIKSLAIQAANKGAMSPEEIKANQLQVDSAVQSITRISNVTNFAGLNLLNGSLDYNLSGVINSQIAEAHIFNAQFASATSIPVNVQVVQSALPAALLWATSQVGSSGVTIEVAGNKGVEAINFRHSASVGTVMSAINGVKDATGVSATWIDSAGNSAAGLVFYSTDYGSESFVSVQALPGQGAFDTTDALGTSTHRTNGQDVAATINGSNVVGKGLELSLNTTYLSLDLKLDPAFAGAANASSFAITGGGALFQLGPHVSINEQRSFGIQSVAATRLGNSTIGFLSQIVTGGQSSLTEGQAQQAAAIIDEAITQVAGLRGRMGAFEKNTIQTNMRSLQVAQENLTASESSIRDADFAAETANLTRGQILTSAATSVLAIANQTPQSVLKLLQ